ncbi:MAG: response regulator [Candidatus Saccharimonas sp.]|nr:response regulator [Candidatus Saccharimonas sp.]
MSSTIVVIDDDPWMSAQLARRLERAGYVVELATDGLEGMELIDRVHPAAIVLDIFMPGPNGIVLLHELRSHSDLAAIPIIVCTSSAADIPRGSLDTYGVRVVLDKVTMDADDVVVAVRSVV